MNRKIFLQQAAVASSAIAVAPYLSFAQTASTQQQSGDDPLLPEKVKEFVIAGHSDLTKKKLAARNSFLALCHLGLGCR